MSKNSLIIGLVVILLIIAVAAGAWVYFSGTEMPGQEGSGEESSDVVARVNGQDITRSKLETAEEQIAAEQGFEISSLDAETRNQLQEQALDILVSYTLVQQIAEQLGVAATEEDITAQVNSIKAQFENDAEYEAALNQEGISESELRSQIAEDLTMQAYIEEALDLAQVTATEEEVMSEYEKAATADEGFPELSEVRGQIELFIIEQKQQQIISQHIQTLQAEADIEILIY